MSGSTDSAVKFVCNVYLNTDFMVTSGVNSGDPITNASDSNLGDTYVFSATATAHELAVLDDGAGSGNSAGAMEDNVGGQTIAAGSEIGNPGEGLELESRLTFMGTDGSTVEVLIINNTSIGPEGGPEYYSGEYFLPLTPLTPGIEYTLIAADIHPGVLNYADHTCICFGRGTRITMADGTTRPVEQICEGDLVLTRDNGAQPVRWVGSRIARAYGHLAPIVFAKGAIGNEADLILSPQHRVLLSDWRAEVMVGARDVLVKARDLVNADTIWRREGGAVEYFHLLLDHHEIVTAEGIPTESLQINPSTFASLDEDQRREIQCLFPDIVEQPQNPAQSSRISLKSYEAAALLRQVGIQ